MRSVKKFISFAPPLIGQDEINEVVDTLKSGWITTGPKSIKFEKLVAKYCGAKYALAVNSCTAVLHLALAALGIKKGDEVITSPFTFASTAHVILYVGAMPVFVDIEPDTFNIDPMKIEKVITNKTKAIIVVHYGGHPCDMDPILRLAKKYGLYVVEDAAHAIGAKYKDRQIGSIGDITCFSFYATKNITTAEGGMLVTNNKKIEEKARILSMYGISDARRIWGRYSPKGSWYYDIKYLGYKYNMTDIQASLGIHQLGKLDFFNKRRSEIAQFYNNSFKRISYLTIPIPKAYAKHAWHVYPLLLKKGSDRNEFIEQLRKKNIGSSVLFQPLHLHSFYHRLLGTKFGDFPVAEDVYRRVVCLPISPSLTKNIVRYIANEVAKAAWFCL